MTPRAQTWEWNTSTEYLFDHEWVTQRLADAALVVDDEHDDDIRVALDIVHDEKVLRLLTDGALREVAAYVAYGLRQRRTHGLAERRDVVVRSVTHCGESCEPTVLACVRERNDMLVGLLEARDWALINGSFNPIHDIVLMPEPFLRVLRPRRDRGPYFFRTPCEWCENVEFHLDGCQVERNLEGLKRRTLHEVRSHTRCVDIVEELLAQTDGLIDEAEHIAAAAVAWSVYEEGNGDVIRLDRIVSLLQPSSWECEDVLTSPATLAGRSIVPLDDWAPDMGARM